jgi:hypothetical protein
MASQPNRDLIAPNQPLLLTLEEIASPSIVIEHFLGCFDMESLRRLYELLLFTAMEMDDERLGLEITRSELSLFFEQLPKIFEAMYCLGKEWNKT